MASDSAQLSAQFSSLADFFAHFWYNFEEVADYPIVCHLQERGPRLREL